MCRGIIFPSLEGWRVAPGWSSMRKYIDKYYQLPYNPHLRERAKELRKAGNLCEALMWRQLRNKNFKGYDFDRQKIIGNFIVDFFCIDCGV